MSLQTLHELILQTTWNARCASWSIQAAGIKAYDAPWLDNAKKVMRGPDGRFATKASETAEKMKEVATNLRQAMANIPGAKGLDSARESVADFGDKVLTQVADKAPEHVKDMADLMFGKGNQRLRNETAKKFESISPDFAEGLREDPFKDAGEDIAGIIQGGDRLKSAKALVKDTGRIFEWIGKKYNEGLESLRNLEGPAALKTMGKLAAWGISTGVYLAGSIGPDIAIGLLMAESMPVILTGAVLGLGVSFAVDKVLDAAKIENPAARFAIQTIAGIAAGGAAVGSARIDEARVSAVQEAAFEMTGNREVAEALSKKTGVKTPKKSDLRGKKPLGKGMMGEIHKSKDGSTVHKFGNAAYPIQQSEIEMSIRAGDAGVGPKVQSFNHEGYSMEFLNGYKPLVGGNVFKRMAAKGDQYLDVADEQVDKLIDGITDQVGKLHKNNIAHQDMHFQNIMMGPDGDVKIIDYGLAKDVSLDPSSRNHELQQDLFKIVGNFSITKTKRSEAMIEAMLDEAGVSGLQKSLYMTQLRNTLTSKGIEKLNIKSFYSAADEDLWVLRNGTNIDQAVDANMSRLNGKLKDFMSSKNTEWDDIVRSEVAKLVPGADQGARVAAAKEPSLFELLRQRKDLTRQQRLNPSNKVEKRIQELDVAIAFSDEELTTDDAYALMVA